MCFRPPTAVKKVKCPACGEMIPDKSKTCPKCGADLTAPAGEEQKPNT